MAEVGRTLLISFRLRFSFLQRTRFWGLGGVYDGSLSTRSVLRHFELPIVDEI